MSGVQHVDCATFSTLSFFLMNHVIRERERERKEKGNERKRKRGRGRRRRGRGRERERERKNKRKRKNRLLLKRLFFLLLAPGSALEKFAAVVNPENKPTKVNWALSWPSALKICGKTVL